jgi:hypothetical protein
MILRGAMARAGTRFPGLQHEQRRSSKKTADLRWPSACYGARSAMSTQSAAIVIDLAEYRRRKQPQAEGCAMARPQVMWVPTAWGYWVPVWSTR